MNAVFRKCLLPLLIVIFAVTARAQTTDGLVARMRQHESYVLLMYLEYQKLYYEDKSRVHELQAFEKLLTVYIDQITEIYETLNLAAQKSEVPRDIASRTLIFKALMFLEKAPLNHQYFERASYEYYAALDIYDGTNGAPVIYKDLPQPIQAGTKTYYRLLDILEDKGTGLQDFGKVQISFRNFMVTANFDPERLELIRLPGPGHTGEYTFELAETRIKEAFAQVFRKVREVETYVALPAGTYILRLHGGSKSDYTALTRFYVRANQQQHYVLEPLADWIVLYENPDDKRPDYYKYRRNSTTLAADGLSTAVGFESQNGEVEANGSAGALSSGKHQQLVAEIVRDFLPNFEIKMMFDLNDPEIRDNAVEIISKSIVEYLDSPDYYYSWSEWTSSWTIANKVREVISPGSLVPIELVELVHAVVNEL